MNWIIFERAMFCVEDDRGGPVAAVDHVLERDGRRAPGPRALIQLDASRRCVCRRVETDVGTVGRAAIARAAAIGLPERARAPSTMSFFDGRLGFENTEVASIGSPSHSLSS